VLSEVNGRSWKISRPSLLNPNPLAPQYVSPAARAQHAAVKIAKTIDSGWTFADPDLGGLDVFGPRPHKRAARGETRSENVYGGRESRL
jgi:hypothetical protein